MTIRVSKALLLFALGFYYALVVFNNTNDYNSNLTFVRHVLLMDTTFPGNQGMWRAIHAPAVPWLFFVSIVCWEIVTGLLCWWAGFRLIRNLHSSAAVFNAAKKLGVVALTLSLLMWLSAFLSCWQRVVPDVAVEGMERPVGRRSHVRYRRHHPALPRHARRGRSGVAERRNLLFSQLSSDESFANVAASTLTPFSISCGAEYSSGR